MPRDYDTLFANALLTQKVLPPAQVQACLAEVVKLEDSGAPKPLAIVAVEKGFLPAAAADKVVRAINQKYPGKHPALAFDDESLATIKAAPDMPTRATLVAPTPKRGRGAPRPPLAPPPRKSPAFFIGLAGGAAALVAVVLVFALRGNPPEPQPPAPEPPAARKAPPILPTPPRDVELPPPPVEPPRPKPAPTAPDVKPEPPKPADDDGRAPFYARLAGKRREAEARLKEARFELDEDKKAEAEAARALRQRLGGKSLTITLRAGASYPKATVRHFSYTDVEIEDGGKKLSVPWSTVQPASLLAAADALYEPGNADHQFERGRFLAANKHWREAAQAFDRAMKIDEGYTSRVEEVKDYLDRLISGQGGFRGAARRVGRDGLVLTYDFQKEEQLGDFTPGLSLKKGAAVLEAERRRAVYLGDWDYVDEVEADLKVAFSGKLTFIFFAGERGGYEIELGPDAVTLFKTNSLAATPAERRKELAKSDKAKLPKDTPHALRVTARGRQFRLFLDKKELLAAVDPPPTTDALPLRGRFGLGIEGGKAALSPPLSVVGTLDPRELDKRLAEVEALMRRADDKELKDIEKMRIEKEAEEILGRKAVQLTADDAYFTFRIKSNADLTAYDGVKRAAAQDLSFGREEEEVKAPLDRLIGLYPAVPSLYYLRAQYHWERSDLAAARQDLRKALEIFPEFAEALVLQARVQLWEGDPASALASCQKAIESKPDHASAYVQRAMASFSAGADPRLDDLRLALKLQPANREAFSYLRVLKYASRGPRDLGCVHEVETEHYRVTTDIGPEAARLYGERLEAAYRHFAETWKRVYRERPFRKPRVAVFNTSENYYTYFELLNENRGDYTLGVFRPALNELVLFEDVDLEASLQVLHHEQFHHFATLLSPQPFPYWYNEGIAEYMSSIRVKDGKVVKTGLLLMDRLQPLQLTMGMGLTYPWERIMCETPREFYSGAVSLKYAAAWSILHFLYEAEGGKHRALAERYFDELIAGKTPRQAFDAVFKDKVEALTKEWSAYVKALKH